MNPRRLDGARAHPEHPEHRAQAPLGEAKVVSPEIHNLADSQISKAFSLQNVLLALLPLAPLHRKP